MNWRGSKTRCRVHIHMKKWQCLICGFIYDEAEGLEDEGIPPGTKWADIPDDFSCPECGSSKDDFEMLEIGRSNFAALVTRERLLPGRSRSPHR